MQLADLNLSVLDMTSSIKHNDKIITTKQYLPVNTKLELISWIINQSADDMKFYNVGKIDIFKALGIIKYYTNIEITDEDLENPTNLYDLLVSSGLYNEVLFIIPVTEKAWIDKVLMDTVDSIYKYRNSAMGILDTVAEDYENLNFDIEKLQQNISNPENLSLLKDVVTKLG